MSAALCIWDKSPTQPVDGYNIYIKKDVALGFYTKANPSVITATQYTITGLAPGTYKAYEAAVRGTNESDPSNIVTFTIEFNSLYKPKNLQSSVLGSDATLSWDYVPGISTYNLYMKDSVGSYTKQNTGLITDNQFEVTGLAAETYTWYVASVFEGAEINSDTDSFTI